MAGQLLRKNVNIARQDGDHDQFDEITEDQSATIAMALVRPQADCILMGDLQGSAQITE